MSKIEVNEIDVQSGTTITVGSACKSVAVPGNVVKTNAVQASDAGNIISQSGTTITIGASGDTVSLASGASQSGFGRAGSVDWQTGSIKTSTFTATSGEGYFCNTSGGAFTVNLPAGSAGAIVAVSDYTRTFQNNNLTISPNGSEKIGGVAADATLSTEGQTATFVYVDSTEGWINVQETSNSVTGRSFITATGGTITTSGNFKIHSFTSPGTFCVSAISTEAAENTVGYMVLAGGGGGGNYTGGGGGGGGFREGKNAPIDNFTGSPLVASAPTNAVTITATGFPITVGAGGAGKGSGGGAGSRGNNSVFSTITSTGGGGGKGNNTNSSGAPGGSGAGGTENQPSTAGAGSGNTPSVSPPQGQNGGTGSGPGPNNDYYEEAGGGGGAGATGGNGTHNGGTPTGNGGNGVATSITGSPVTYAGGAGGGKGAISPAPSPSVPQGGTGGGGNGSYQATQATTGTANTGGGGGGSGASPSEPDSVYHGKDGGSGIVIIRYKYQ